MHEYLITDTVILVSTAVSCVVPAVARWIRSAHHFFSFKKCFLSPKRPIERDLIPRAGHGNLTEEDLSSTSWLIFFHAAQWCPKLSHLFSQKMYLAAHSKKVMSLSCLSSLSNYPKTSYLHITQQTTHKLRSTETGDFRKIC